MKGQQALIEGPKWCGKTTSAIQKAKTVVKLQDPRKSKDLLKLADIEPLALLQGDVPVLVDEWQMAPSLWDTIRAEVDERSRPGQFILTGSSVPHAEDQMHSGTGRIARLMMRPMSLFESLESTGAVSLEKLFTPNTALLTVASKLSIHDLAFLICRGGWPSALKVERNFAHLIAKDYLNSVCESDASKVDGIEKKPSRVREVLRSYARNISTLATNKTIIDDIKSNDIGIAESTLYSYLNALTRLFIIEDIPAWNPAIRSKSVMRAANKKGFVDPSLAAAALGLTYKTMLDDMKTFGFLFESLCIRDLRSYITSLGGRILYYRDRQGLECDAVVYLDDGRYGLTEIKLGEKEIEAGAAHLLKLAALIDNHDLKKPEFLMILTGGQRSYRREDGVLIVPIGCLGP